MSRPRSTRKSGRSSATSDDAPAVGPSPRSTRKPRRRSKGQEIAFRIQGRPTPPVEVTKTYRIWKGEDGFEVELKFASPLDDSKFTYKLYGPHGIPIEGEWYTSTFRDVFFAMEGGKSIATHASTEVVKYKDDPSPDAGLDPPLEVRRGRGPVFRHLRPALADRRGRWRSGREQEAGPVLFTEDFKAPQKSDVGVEITLPADHARAEPRRGGA